MQMNLLVVSQQDAAPAWFTITPRTHTHTQHRKRPCGCLRLESIQSTASFLKKGETVHCIPY